MPPKATRTQGPPNGAAALLPEGHAGGVPSENQRARREVEREPVGDGYDEPHRRSLNGDAHPSSRLAPKTHTQPSR
jgi:hypothetical protein